MVFENTLKVENPHIEHLKDLIMTYNKRSKFTWSFTGFGLENEAMKALEEMEEWFKKTYNESEWTVTTSVSQTVYGFRAEMNAQRDSEEE